MNSLTSLINHGVTSIEQWGERGVTGVHVSFQDETSIFIGHGWEDNEPLIRIFGTSENGGTNTQVPLQSYALIKAKLMVQELTTIIEKIEAEQFQE